MTCWVSTWSRHLYWSSLFSVLDVMTPWIHFSVNYLKWLCKILCVCVLLMAFSFSLLSIIWFKFILFIDCLIELFCFCKFIALSYLNRGICRREKGRNCRCGLKSCLSENPLPGLWFRYLITALVQLLEGLLPPAAPLLLVYLAQVPMRVCLSPVQRSH